jgi:hypothetical protein
MLFPLDAELVAAAVLLVADRIPAFDVEPFCRSVAQRAAPAADLEVWLRKEQEARQGLARHGRTSRPPRNPIARSSRQSAALPNRADKIARAVSLQVREEAVGVIEC